MGVKYTNNARTTLNGSVTNVATSIVVTDGSVFPAAGGADYFYMTLENAAGTTREIVKVTARSTNTLTVVRGQDGTTATAFANADKAELRMVSAILTDLSSSSYIVSALAGQAVSAASYNKVAITAPATGSTLTIVDGKTLTASNTLTLAGTDSSTLNIGAGGTLGALAVLATGAEGKTIRVVSGTPAWVDPSGISVAARQTSNFNAVASTLYPVDTTSGAITATLPASPAQGDRIGFYDAAGTWDTNNLTIGRNGNNIAGAALDLIADVEWVGFTLAWDATRGWAIAQ